MKKLFNFIKVNAIDLANKAKIMATTAMLSTAVVNNGMVSAAGGDPSSVVKAAIDVVVKMFPYVGAFFVVAGVFKLIMAYRNDQPEAQAGAAKDIVIGAVFIVFKVFVWTAIEPTIF